jgi:hypothetical protein
VCEILLFQAIKNVPIYSKAVRELCIRKCDRKCKDPQTMHVMGKLSNLMMGGFLATKFYDPESLVVNVKINNTLICKKLIDLGVVINLMT